MIIDQLQIDVLSYLQKHLGASVQDARGEDEDVSAHSSFMEPRSRLRGQSATDLGVPFPVTHSWDARLTDAYSRNFTSLLHDSLCLSQDFIFLTGLQ